ncbi:type 1 glutamine amidotransferase domain-containing protein [Atlantibacter subterranea]|uniref:Type 1 glutamine amidotransferase domain-containing protein n=1 Tax=Atlantibacter subterraneus TaxID=255519 RepID=A0ABU4E5F1_9ENTR|nr:type 1 glutamine amidotransferase domain-containing protein [Atlantibacter subterranea]MDV7024357.1 type 1 glutamine amidotransferase domain-containing protein [Atlantibacter subterranea]MDZ5667453.1 type 1 glutamine amidotransferase domain-containing protein [Atlantibacter hermannii]
MTQPTRKPVLFVLTSYSDVAHNISGFYFSELVHPLHVLEQAGIPGVFASIQGGLPPVYGVDLDDDVNARYWNDDAFQQRLSHTLKLSDTRSDDYSAVLFVGGHGTMWDFPDCPDVQRLIRDLYEADKPVAAVCHGPAALVNATLSDGRYLVDGKRVAAFTDAEEHAVKLAEVVPFLLETTLKKRGALHQAVGEWQPLTLVDGNLITGQNPQSATGVGEALRNKLNG